MGRRGEEGEGGGGGGEERGLRPLGQTLGGAAFLPTSPRSTPRPLSPPFPAVPAQRGRRAQHVASARAGKDVGVVDVANGGTGPSVCSLLFRPLR